MNEQNATESYTVNGQFDVNFTSMKNNYNKQNIWKRFPNVLIVANL